MGGRGACTKVQFLAQAHMSITAEARSLMNHLQNKAFSSTRPVRIDLHLVLVVPGFCDLPHGLLSLRYLFPHTRKR